MPQASLRIAAALLALLIAPRLSVAEPTVRFAQITDAHIIDAPFKEWDKNGKRKDDYAENKRALQWAVDEINRRNCIGPKFDFVVFTGDLGLEYVKGAQRNDGIEVPLKTAVAEFAAVIEGSEVSQWLIVPGNNDLPDEDPKNIHVFHDYVSELNAALKLKGKVDIRDLGPQDPPATQPATFQKGNCLFVGFDNSSFKKDFGAGQVDCVSRLVQLVPQDMKNVYVFCHIPDTDDPFDDGSGNLKAAWNVDPATHNVWTTFVNRPQVKRVFAGHFHSADRWRYTDLNWTRKGPGLPIGLEKLQVCPPLAIKFQVGSKETARGFRDVSVYGDTGQVASEIVWYEGGNVALPLAAPTGSSTRKCLIVSPGTIVWLFISTAAFWLLFALGVHLARRFSDNPNTGIIWLLCFSGITAAGATVVLIALLALGLK
jgi:hypothetical protein